MTAFRSIRSGKVAAFGVGWHWSIRVANNNIDMNITIDNPDMF